MLLDQSADGYLDADELSSYMKKMGCPLSRAQIEEMMKNLDKDGDGSVPYDEFLRAVSSRLQ